MLRANPLSILLIVTSIAGCGDDGGGTNVSPATVEAAVSTYAEIVHSSYVDSVTLAVALDGQIDAFAEFPGSPTPAGLTASRDAWLAARRPYLQTEVYRFYDGPIDNAVDGPEGFLNAWPMNEAHVDYVMGDASAGIINDPGSYPTIDAMTLMALNEAPGETDVAVGWHPIEFLLWGQDLTAPSMNLPGQRAYTDFVDAGGTASNEDRRRDYLRAISDLLVAQLTELRDAWAPAVADNYRSDFESAEPMDSLEKILTGMIILSGFEVAGERLQVALDNGDQEDEHSCFSDNTRNDMLYDAIGVQNAYLGTYAAEAGGTAVDGVGIHDIVLELDEELAEELRYQIEHSVATAMALQDPFDSEISAGNASGNLRVQELITSLRAQEVLLEEVFSLLGFTVPQPE